MALSTIGIGFSPVQTRALLERAATQTAGDAPTTTADPVDTFVPGQAPAVPSSHDVRAAAAGDKSKDAAIDGMTARDTGLQGADPTQQRDLHEALGAVDTPVLQYAQSRGVKMQVVRPGDDLRQAGVLRQQDPKDLDRLVPEMAKFTKELDADLKTRFDEPMAKLQGEREARLKATGQQDNPFAGQGLFGAAPDPELSRIGEQTSKLYGDKGKAMVDALDARDLPLTPFHMPGVQGGGGMESAVMANMMNSMPLPTDAMAEVHGFRTKEEKAQFNGWVEGINGDRLTAARQESMKNLTEMAAKDPDNPEMKALLAQAKENPGMIPVDHRKHNILVPDIHAYREPAPGQKPGEPPPPPTGKPQLLDEHDLQTLRNWNTPEGTRVAKPFDPDTGEGSGLLGQYFTKGDVNRIIIRDEAIKDGTPAHELGHAVDFLVEKEDPAFHKPWKQRLDASFEAAGKMRDHEQISAYSRTNEREYLAEGFKLYYEDRKLLQAKDPALLGLVEELTKHAAALQEGKPR